MIDNATHWQYYGFGALGIPAYLKVLAREPPGFA